jgi:CubicO group peptidase (beta-lactamase class C family)
MRFRLLAALAALTLTPAALVGQADRTSRIEQGLRAPNVIKGQPITLMTLADRMTVLNVPGVSVAVVDEGKVAWVRAYGQTGDGAAVTPETLFQAASLSKPVAAMVALRLVELGKLSLDEDVNVKLRSWKLPASPAAQGELVTLRRLLSHTAGLTVSGFPGYVSTAQVPSLVQLLDGATPANTAPIRVDVKPGSIYRYSGGGYEVMQQLVEDVTGQPFAEVARTLVLEPLGMSHSTFQQPLTGSQLAASAVGHDGRGVAIRGHRNTYPEQTAAGLWTTPSDYAQVILEIQKPGRVLKPATVDTMLTPVLSDYGLGFGVQTTNGQVSFSHGGSNNGFKCQMRGYRTLGRGAIVMTNGDNGSRLASEMLRAIASEYDWPDLKPVERTAVPVPVETLRTYEGRYILGGFEAVVALKGDQLTIAQPGQTAFPLVPTGEGAFFNLMGAVPDITFSKAADGSLQLSAGNVKAVRQAVP